MASEEVNVALQAPAKGPAKGPGKGPSKGPPKGKGKSPAAEQASPAVEEPKEEAAPEPSEAKAEAVAEVKESAEAPVVATKGPGKGPSKGPPKGKGKSPAAEQAAPAVEEPKEEAAPEPSEAKAEAVAEVKESAEAPVVAAKGPGKGPSKGPPKGKGKSPAAEQAAPAVEEPKEEAAPEPSEAKTEAVAEVKESAEAPVVATKGPGKGPSKGPPKGKGKSPAAEQAAPAVEEPKEEAAPEPSEANAEAVAEVKESAEAPVVATKGPGKGPSKGPPKGKGKSPAAEQAAPAVEEPKEEAAPEPSEANAEAVAEVKESAEAPVVATKGPGKGPSKGPPKGKGKSPAAEQAAPAIEEPKEEAAPEPSEAKAEAVAEVKESAEAPVVAAKGPGKGPSKGPPKGKGKSPAAEQAAPAIEEPKEEAAPEPSEAKAEAVAEVKESAEAPVVATKGPGKGPSKGPPKGKGKSPAAEQAAPAIEEPKEEAAPEPSEAKAEAVAEVKESAEAAPAAEDAKAAEAAEPNPETKETGEAKADAVEEVKETAEAPAVTAKGPGKGPAKGPSKGKGKSPAAEQAAPAAEDAKAAEAAEAPEPNPETKETGEAKADAVEEVKETAEAPAAAAKGLGKGPAKGPSKGKGKSPVAEQAAPAAEDAKAAETAEAPEPNPQTKETGEAKADAVEEVKETAEAPAVTAKGPGKGSAKGPSKGKGKSPAAEQAAPAAEDAKAAEAAEGAEPNPETKETGEAKADAVEEVKETAEAPAVTAKGPGKGSAKGPSKGKGKSPAAEQAAPAAEDAKAAEAPETNPETSVQPQGTKGVKFEEPVHEAPAALVPSKPVDLNVSHVNGQLLKRGPVFGYAFQARWCILTNTQLIVYKDERFSQRQSAERLSYDAKAARFSCHDAPGEAVKHKSDKPCGFVLDSNPMAGKGRKLSYFDAENEEKIAIWLEAIAKVVARRKEAVTLHVYDMAAAGSIEGDTKPLGTGHFHVGIEINGSEWSYGFNELGSGVFECKPTHCEPHSYRDAIELGYTSLRENEISEKISKLKDEWPGLPPWILRLASAEGQGANGANDKARKSAIIMAAQVRGTPHRKTVNQSNCQVPGLIPEVTRRLAWLRHLELLAAMLGAGMWMVGLWSSEPRHGPVRSWRELQLFLADGRNSLLLLGFASVLLYHLMSFSLAQLHVAQVRADGLHRAAARGDAEALSRILRDLERSEASTCPRSTARSLLVAANGINAPNADGWTALHLAAATPHAERGLRVLLRAQAEVSPAHPVSGMTPLMLSAEAGMDKALRMLLSSGASQALQQSNHEGNSALHLAVREGHSECIHRLLRARADPSATNAQGFTAFDFTRSQKFTEAGMQQVVKEARSELRTSLGEDSLPGSHDPFQFQGAEPSSRGPLLTTPPREVTPQATPRPSASSPTVTVRSVRSGVSGVLDVPVLPAPESALDELLAEASRGGALRFSHVSHPAASVLTEGTSRSSPSRSPLARQAAPQPGARSVKITGLASLVAVASPGALRRLAAGAARRPGRSVMGSAVSSDSEKDYKLSSFRIVGLIGEGSFGSVYEACDLRPGAGERRCALKILHRRQYLAQ
ncbi:unnamed protein product, partial [Cladocopium goreaui]